MTDTAHDPTTLDGYKEWGPQGACHDYRSLSWYTKQGETLEPMLTICRTECPVREQCLAWGLKRELHGIWGGESERGRKIMRKAKKVFLEAPQANFLNLGRDYFPQMNAPSTNAGAVEHFSATVNQAYRHIVN